MKYCPNANCRHLATSGSQAEYLERVAVCADCGAALVAEPGALVQLPPTQHDSTESEETTEELADRQARLDVQSGVFAVLAGIAITIGTMFFPTNRGTSLVALGPILYGVVRLARGLDRGRK